MPLDQVNIDDEILDRVHVSIYYQPIYYQSILDKLKNNIKKTKTSENERSKYKPACLVV